MEVNGGEEEGEKAPAGAFCFPSKFNTNTHHTHVNNQARIKEGKRGEKWAHHDEERSTAAPA